MGNVVGFPKANYYRSKNYRDFVKLRPCMVEGMVPKYQCVGVIEFHHIETGGMGIKGSDLAGVSLCSGHHAQGESPGWGWKTFELIYGVDFKKEADFNLRYYVISFEAKRGIT